MKTRARDGSSRPLQIPLRLHPRVFAALGADLVTSDIVAVIELVKNAYDAFADNVWLRFRTDPSRGSVLEVQDDGQGMTLDVIENAWCLVATPYKEQRPVVERRGKKRRVVGEKGLGRLSVARLGRHLRMLTQAQGSRCWEVTVDWSDVAGGDEISNSFVQCRESSQELPLGSGTILQISGLVGRWDAREVSELKENLARLVSPFSDFSDFNIFLSDFDTTGTEEVAIESPAFLASPKYRIQGAVDPAGNVTAVYAFRSLVDDAARDEAVELTWTQVYDNIDDRNRFPFSSETAHCGPFSFQVRAWDVDTDGTQEISERFDFQKNQVRKSIRAHKGISVYRDRMLVLPKSEGARDWLGLDLRRVSRVGPRLSTSQLVGYVSISADDNPTIRDTSDRERLMSCLEVAEFEELLKAVVGLLENERKEDRLPRGGEELMEDLFGQLSARQLQRDVQSLQTEGGNISEAVSVIRDFGVALDVARKKIQQRFVYYSRLATVGTIAHMLVHEIRNRTTAVGSFLAIAKERLSPFRDRDIEDEFRSADLAVDALERLADTFAPLASRNFRRRKRHSIVEDEIRNCLALERENVAAKQVQCRVPESKTAVAVDPGELEAVILNLITNAVFWLGRVPKGQRVLEFAVGSGTENGRVRVVVSDSGPGIKGEDVERVFWPGMTRKPSGIGMGLTVASELVAAYGGRMSVAAGGERPGATFVFDLPLRKP